MNVKKTGKKLLIATLAVFILMNVVAYFHAYKFTHFDSSITIRTSDPKKLSFAQKIKTIFLGVNNPRPENKSLPDRAYKTIRLKSNKIIECWVVNSTAHKGTVILFHGYSGEKSSLLGRSQVFLDLGYNTVLVDFMGSGGSEGNQTTIGTKEAEEVKTVYDYIDSSGEKNIILFGTSMGATAIMKAVADYKLHAQAYILECPFGSLLKTVQARFHSMHIPSFPMANLLVFWGGVQNGFEGFEHDPIIYAKSISAPALLLHGDQDDKVSRQETEDIYNNLTGPKVLKNYPLTGHDIYMEINKEKWKSDVSSFLEKIK
jgi:dipeptidyl aminopeptidase/acylaminoacyl peptidase